MSDQSIDIEEMSVLLGGPLRLVERVEGAGASQCILIRGGPGVGKSIVATYMATQIAAALSTNVAYACVELLPLELRAQQEALGATNGWSVLLPEEWSTPGAQHILAAALDLGERKHEPTTQDAFGHEIIEVFERARVSTEIGVRVLVIDSVSSDYGLGGRRVPRHLVDAVAKFAAVNGIVVIVIEETHDLAPSPWSFASDTVIEIDGAPTLSGQRRIRVAKNRFGPATNAFGDLRIVSAHGPMIYAPAAAYSRLGWSLLTAARRPKLKAGKWPSVLDREDLPARDRGALVFVQGQHESLMTERIAAWIARGESQSSVVELHYGQPRGVAVTRARPGPTQDFAAPLGVIAPSAEHVLDALRLLLEDATSVSDVAGVHVVVPSQHVVEVEEFVRTMDALSNLCATLGLPVVCSRSRFGEPDDVIVSLLRQAAALNVTWQRRAGHRLEIELHCVSPQGAFVLSPMSFD